MTQIRNFITTKVETLQVEANIAEAQNVFLDANYSHIPIFDQTLFIGSISKEDAEIFPSSDSISTHRYSLHRFFVREKTSWFDVFEAFSKNNCTLLPVLDENNIYLGVYELDDVLHCLNETPFLKANGSILIIEKNATDFTFSQISQIVESNHAQILGAFISQTTEQTTQITLKITEVNLNEIIQTFRRYNYTVLSEHHEDSYLNSLKERSDYLDTYLKI